MVNINSYSASGLHESHVDSDEEDLAESIGSFTLRLGICNMDYKKCLFCVQSYIFWDFPVYTSYKMYLHLYSGS